MRNERGQALIEFLMIVPVVLIIIMAVLDFGNILYHRYELENHLDFIADLYQNEKETELEEYLQKYNLSMEINRESDYQILYVKRKLSISTPGLGKILGDPYSISSSKTIYEGEHE